jgi:hypothetical protein
MCFAVKHDQKAKCYRCGDEWIESIEQRYCYEDGEAVRTYCPTCPHGNGFSAKEGGPRRQTHIYDFCGQCEKGVSEDDDEDPLANEADEFMGNYEALARAAQDQEDARNLHQIEQNHQAALTRRSLRVTRSIEQEMHYMDYWTGETRINLGSSRTYDEMKDRHLPDKKQFKNHMSRELWRLKVKEHRVNTYGNDSDSSNGDASLQTVFNREIYDNWKESVPDEVSNQRSNPFSNREHTRAEIVRDRDGWRRQIISPRGSTYDSDEAPHSDSDGENRRIIGPQYKGQKLAFERPSKKRMMASMQDSRTWHHGFTPEKYVAAQAQRQESGGHLDEREEEEEEDYGDMYGAPGDDAATVQGHSDGLEPEEQHPYDEGEDERRGAFYPHHHYEDIYAGHEADDDGDGHSDDDEYGPFPPPVLRRQRHAYGIGSTLGAYEEMEQPAISQASVQAVANWDSTVFSHVRGTPREERDLELEQQQEFPADQNYDEQPTETVDPWHDDQSDRDSPIHSDDDDIPDGYDVRDTFLSSRVTRV